MNRVLLIIGFIFTLADSHSWLACSDYRINSANDSNYYNYNNCKGKPRGYAGVPSGSPNCDSLIFGGDCGFEQRGGTTLCRSSLTNPLSNSYTASAPMAVYAPGQRVCLAWPAKNHVAATCYNVNIPDRGTQIYMHGPNPTTEPTLGTAQLIYTFETNTAPNQYKGFQNCPKFCENTDKAVCTGCFNLPSNLQSGASYTFVWKWEFNAGEIYSTCWDAMIQGTPVTGNQPTQPTTLPPTSQGANSNAPKTTQTFTSRPTSQPSQAMTQDTNNGQGTNGQGCTDPTFCATTCGTADKILSCTCTNGQFSVQCGDAVHLVTAIWLLAICYFALL